MNHKDECTGGEGKRGGEKRREEETGGEEKRREGLFSLPTLDL